MRALLRHQAGAVVATAVDFSVMIGSVTLAGLSPASATALGAASGGIANFILGRRWIFRVGHGGVGGQIGRYALVSLASMLLNTAGEHLLAGSAHVQYVFARIVVAVAVSVLWNFPMQRSFVFRAAPSNQTGKTPRTAIAPLER